MATTTEKLQEKLESRVAEVKSLQTTQFLLESMGFFALMKLHEAYSLTKDAVSSSTESFSGGLILLFKKMIKEGKPRRAGYTGMLEGFTPVKTLS